MKLKTKIMTQYCIDAQYVDEVMKSIPSNVKVEMMSVRIGNRNATRKATRTNKQTKLGVTSVRRTVPGVDVLARLSNMSRATMVKQVKLICKEFDLPYDIAVVTRITLSYEGVTSYWTRVTKEIHPDETDQRKKLVVIGHTSADGNVAPTIKTLSAKKYSCKFERVYTTHIICSELS